MLKELTIVEEASNFGKELVLARILLNKAIAPPNSVNAGVPVKFCRQCEGVVS